MLTRSNTIRLVTAADDEVHARPCRDDTDSEYSWADSDLDLGSLYLDAGASETGLGTETGIDSGGSPLLDDFALDNAQPQHPPSPTRKAPPVPGSSPAQTRDTVDNRRPSPPPVHQAVPANAGAPVAAVGASADAPVRTDMAGPASAAKIRPRPRPTVASTVSFPPTLVAFLRDTSDYPSQPGFAAAAATLVRDDNQTPTGETNTKGDNHKNTGQPQQLSATSVASCRTVTMTLPAGPVPVANTDLIPRASPLSHLRNTLETYQAKTPGHTRSGSQSSTPRTPKRLAQQSTQDFVVRTSRSIARAQEEFQKHSDDISDMDAKMGSKEIDGARGRRVSRGPQPQPRPTPTHYTTTTGMQQPWQRPAPLKQMAGAKQGPPKTDRPLVLRKKKQPGELFASLPGEVLELILDRLKSLHYSFTTKQYTDEHSSCATCWMRDACSMSLAARKLTKYARAALYESIELVGHDAQVHNKHGKYGKYGKHKHDKHKHDQPTASAGCARLTLLLRTLRARPQIAAIVRSLKVPALSLVDGAMPDDLETVVASVVVACPNLERVVGFHPSYDHATHSRYFQALSTRRRLKEITWLIEPLVSDEERARQQLLQQEHAASPKAKKDKKTHRSRARSISAFMRPHALPSPPTSPPPDESKKAELVVKTSPRIDLRQGARFLNHHVNWQYLASLTIHCKPGATMACDRPVLMDVLGCLPRLQHLHLSGLRAGAFDDAVLAHIPSTLKQLKTLALVHTPGISASGLSAFASAARVARSPLTTLKLVHVENLSVGALPAISRTLSNLTSLASFVYVHKQQPTLPRGESVVLFPYFASASVSFLHWDITSSASAASTADSVLARSIDAGGFPALCRLRAPADPEGLFQGLCRPRERIEKQGDTLHMAHFPEAFRHRHSESSGSTGSVFSGAHARTNSGFSFRRQLTPPSSMDGDADDKDKEDKEDKKPKKPATGEFTSLRTARVAAQARIGAATQTPRFLVHVTNEDDVVVDTFGIGGFIGKVGSPIVYWLEPDTGASDEKGGLVDIEDVVSTETAGDDGDDGDDGGDGGDGDSFKVSRMCSGQWNADWDVPIKKDRERWHHTERQRWQPVGLF